MSHYPQQRGGWIEIRKVSLVPSTPRGDVSILNERQRLFAECAIGSALFRLAVPIIQPLGGVSEK